VFTRVYINLSKRARALFPFVLCAALFCYFSLHFTGGKYGLESHERLEIKVASLKATLKDLSHKKETLQKRIELVGINRAKRDMVDELARKSLQYAAPQDLVLFD
jgi:cell division protein FtsB